MAFTTQITFVVAVNNRDVLEQNLLSSPCLRFPHSHEVLIQEKFPSAALAYNDGMQRASNDLVIFIHQDMFLPEAWLSRLEMNLQYLDENGPDWGVLGCWGARTDGSLVGHIYSSGLGLLGEELENPLPVQTLDEIVLVVRKNSGLFFDETLPHFHFYGADICMTAASRRLNCYAMSAFCVHNTAQILRLPEEFYDCYAHVKRVWRNCLPIQTTCIRISRFNSEVYRRKLEDFCQTAFLDSRCPAPRVIDPSEILKQLEYAEASGRGPK
jgi:hypothetical protein